MRLSHQLLLIAFGLSLLLSSAAFASQPSPRFSFGIRSSSTNGRIRAPSSDLNLFSFVLNVNSTLNYDTEVVQQRSSDGIIQSTFNLQNRYGILNDGIANVLDAGDQQHLYVDNVADALSNHCFLLTVDTRSQNITVAASFPGLKSCSFSALFVDKKTKKIFATRHTHVAPQVGWIDPSTGAFAIAKTLDVPDPVFAVKGHFDEKTRLWWRNSMSASVPTLVSINVDTMARSTFTLTNADPSQKVTKDTVFPIWVAIDGVIYALHYESTDPASTVILSSVTVDDKAGTAILNDLTEFTDVNSLPSSSVVADLVSKALFFVAYPQNQPRIYVVDLPTGTVVHASQSNIRNVAALGVIGN